MNQKVCSPNSLFAARFLLLIFTTIVQPYCTLKQQDCDEARCCLSSRKRCLHHVDMWVWRCVYIVVETVRKGTGRHALPLNCCTDSVPLYPVIFVGISFFCSNFCCFSTCLNIWGILPFYVFTFWYFVMCPVCRAGSVWMCISLLYSVCGCVSVWCDSVHAYVFVLLVRFLFPFLFWWRKIGGRCFLRWQIVVSFSNWIKKLLSYVFIGWIHSFGLILTLIWPSVFASIFSIMQIQ